jgi:hypothetical protein
VRAHLPAAIRARLEAVEARMRAKKRSLAISYSTTTPAGRAAPRPLPGSPGVDDRAEGAGQ